MKKVEIHSPNSVVANPLERTIDIIRPRIVLDTPQKVCFNVGTQINGPPHIGTNLTQVCAFLLANECRQTFGVDATVSFVALDNAPFDVILEPESHHAYQITYFHKYGKDQIKSLIKELYSHFFQAVFDLIPVEYSISLFSEQQQEEKFRSTFIESLKLVKRLKWIISPSYGRLPVRLPCPECHWAEKRAERTILKSVNSKCAIFSAHCYEHGEYDVEVTADPEVFVDINTIYRNIIKEAVLLDDEGTLHVMIKGGDWSFACQYVDWGLSLLRPAKVGQVARIFAPQILTETGAKLSKTMIKEKETALPSADMAWMLNVGKWDGESDDYVKFVIWMAESLLKDPINFYRSYSHIEVQRFKKEWNKMPKKEQQARKIRIYKKYFDLIKSGEKTIEVRVGYSSMRRIQSGQFLRFYSREESCLTKVIRVTEYQSFDEMFKKEDAHAINPNTDAQSQLDEIRKIFPKDKEDLGVLAIEISICT